MAAVSLARARHPDPPLAARPARRSLGLGPGGGRGDRGARRAAVGRLPAAGVGTPRRPSAGPGPRRPAGLRHELAPIGAAVGARRGAGRPRRGHPPRARRHRAGRRGRCRRGGRRCGPRHRGGRPPAAPAPRAAAPASSTTATSSSSESGGTARQGMGRALVAAVVRAPAGAARRRAGDSQRDARGDPAQRLGFTRSVVVHNAPPRWTAAGPRPGPAPGARWASRPATPVALYHGASRRIEASSRWPRRSCARAGRRPPRVPRLREPARPARGARSRAAGRGTYPRARRRVPPDELADWVASADVGVMPIQPSTLNQSCRRRTSCSSRSPRAAGGLVSDFPERHRIIAGRPGRAARRRLRPDQSRRRSPRPSGRSSTCRRPARGARERAPAGGPRALELGDRDRPPRRPLRVDSPV